MAKEPIPAEFEAALKAAGLEKFFAECTASHRREYLKWIGEAKRPETRVARSRQAVKRLAAKRKEEEAG
ncbi:MAG: YdeI/OmpD-associated family protein [Verrucomicrobiae bacterium]|nr:YdeI/OmpD-associated family protein [Verrucomicrobiae bacterium]